MITVSRRGAMTALPGEKGNTMEPSQSGTTLDPFKGTIGEDLDRLEVLSGKIGLNRPENALTLLHDLDTNYDRIQQLEEGASSRKVAETQFDVIVASLHKDARLFLRDLGGTAVYQLERAKVKPGPERTWWFLDERIASQRRAAARRVLIIGGAVVIVLVLLGVVYKAFLAPDPQVTAMYALQQSSQDALMNGDLAKSAADIDKGLQIDPKNLTLLVMKGVVLQAQGNSDQAQQVYAQAQQATASQMEFLLARGQAYLMINQSELALADAKSAVALDSSSAQAHLLVGQAYEDMKQYNSAMNEYNLAYDAASKKNQNELAALSRARLAYLMQGMNAQLPIPNQAITPSPTPLK